MKRTAKKACILSAVGVLTILIFAYGAFAAEITEAIPRDASAVLFVNYSKNNFMQKCVGFFNQLASHEDIKTVELLREKLGFSFNDPVFLSSIGTLAVVYMDEMAKGNTPSPQVVPVAVVLKMADKNAFMINLQNMKAAVSKDSKDNEYNLFEKKDSLEIEIIEKKDKSEYFAFCVRDDLFIAGMGEKTAFDSINRVLSSLSKKENIASDETFKDTLKAYPLETPVYFYMSGAFVKRYAAKENILPELNFIKSVCFTFNVDKAKILATGSILTDKNNKDNAFTKYFTIEGGALNAPAMLDRETIFYAGIKMNLDPKVISEDKNLADIKLKIKEGLGIDFEKEVMSWLSNEYFLAFSSYKALALPVLPAPRIYFGIKSKDREACERCMAKMLPAFGLKDFKKERTAETNYYFAQVPTPGNIMPEFGATVAYINDFLIVASSKDAINPLIASKLNSEKSLAATSEFKSYMGNFLNSSIFCIFYNNIYGAELLSSLAKLSPDAKFSEQELDVLKLINGFSGGFTFKNACLESSFTFEINKEIFNKIADPQWLKKTEEKK